MSNSFINGSFAGFIGVIISHPIDTIKTRIQTGNTIKNAIMTKQFYKGVNAPLIGIPLEKSIVFGFYDISKKSGLNNFWSGIIGGLMSTIIVTPIEYIKINLQNKQTLRDLQIKNIYKGIIPTICREVPGFGIYFTTYNHLNTYNYNKSLIKTFLFGGLSGLSAWIFIYPSDLIKTRIQNKDNILSIKKIIMEIYTNNGIKGFYNGFHYAAIRAIFLHGGVFLGYEICNSYN
jgi:hypothetical protein